MSYYKLPLVFEPQPEGGFTVTCPILPELVTEGGTLDEALANVPDAFEAVRELYEHMGRALPALEVSHAEPGTAMAALRVEAVVGAR
jgi:antitoxin HicB